MFLWVQHASIGRTACDGTNALTRWRSSRDRTSYRRRDHGPRYAGCHGCERLDAVSTAAAAPGSAPVFVGIERCHRKSPLNQPVHRFASSVKLTDERWNHRGNQHGNRGSDVYNDGPPHTALDRLGPDQVYFDPLPSAWRLGRRSTQQRGLFCADSRSHLCRWIGIPSPISPAGRLRNRVK